MTQQEIIVNQRRALLVYAQRHGISKACQVFGVSRTTFYKIQKQFVATGSLEPRIRRKPRMPNETSLSKKKMLLRLIRKQPTWGAYRYRFEMREQGVDMPVSTVGYHLRRFGLNNRYRRLVYLEMLQKSNQPLTEKTLRHLRKHCQKIEHGLWPGHIVALDTFFVGHLKGVGRIYQLSGIDLCSRFGWARLYTSKEQTSAVDFVENHLLPRLFQNSVEVERILTDSGSEFTGRAFQNMLADYDIVHRRTPKGKPIYNGYCERYQRTILEEFYQPIFRKRFFQRLEDLQQELDKYLIYYNFKRAHFGLDRDGMIPIQALKSKSAFLQHRFQKLLT